MISDQETIADQALQNYFQELGGRGDVLRFLEAGANDQTYAKWQQEGAVFTPPEGGDPLPKTEVLYKLLLAPDRIAIFGPLTFFPSSQSGEYEVELDF